jgi:hypothetical protein
VKVRKPNAASRWLPHRFLGGKRRSGNSDITEHRAVGHILQVDDPPQMPRAGPEKVAGSFWVSRLAQQLRQLGDVGGADAGGRLIVSSDWAGIYSKLEGAREKACHDCTSLHSRLSPSCWAECALYWPARPYLHAKSMSAYVHFLDDLVPCATSGEYRRRTRQRSHQRDDERKFAQHRISSSRSRVSQVEVGSRGG